MRRRWYPSASARMWPQWREPRIVLIVTRDSSSADTTSSTPPRMKTSFDSLCGLTANSSVAQTDVTFFDSSSSSDASCTALAAIAEMPG